MNETEKLLDKINRRPQTEEQLIFHVLEDLNDRLKKLEGRKRMKETQRKKETWVFTIINTGILLIILWVVSKGV